LSKINIFIGDQGTGKSTVAKLLVCIKNTLFIDKKLEIESKADVEFQKFISHIVGLEIFEYLKNDSYITYETDYLSFIFDNKLPRVTINYDKEFINKLGFDYVYVPAERQMLAILSGALYGLMNQKVFLPFLYTRFGSHFDQIKRKINIFNFKDIIGVNYSFQSDRDYVLINDGKELPLEFASSGVQTSIPLLVYLETILNELYEHSVVVKMNELYNNFLTVVEEPELNLFPETQKKVLSKILLDCKKVLEHKNVNNSSISNSLIITTHSPYTLTTLNNLMYAYQVGQKHKKEVNDIIPEKYWVNPEDVRCYMMKDGGAELIMDKEGLIKSSLIDSVSKELNKEYNKIINIEIGLANEAAK
jgi:AAA ATPase domain